MATWPDVQRIGFDLEIAVFVRRYFKFLVGVVEEIGAFAKVDLLHHRRAQRGARAIGPNQGSEVDLPLTAVTIIDEASEA